jgi:mannosyltransferase
MIQRSALLWILLLAALLRFYGLADESLWLDEAISANRIENTYPELLTDFDSHRQGPLYTLVTKAWCDEFGNDEFNLRFTAAVFGVLSVVFVYLLGKELYGRTEGLVAALFMAVNPFAIHYSQDARPYSLFLLCSTASIYFLIRLLQGSKTRWDLLGYIAASTAALYSHPFGPFLVLSIGLIFIGYRWLSREVFLLSWRRVLACSAVVFVLYLPMLFVFARTFFLKIDDPTVAGSWIQAEPIWRMLATLSSYFMHPATASAVFLLIALFLFWELRKRRSSLFPFLTPLSLLISFLLIPWFISVTITPIYLTRFSIPALVGVLIVLGFVFARIPFKYRGILIGILLGLHAMPLYYYYTQIDKDPWRQTIEVLQQRLQENDMIVLIPTVTKRPFDYYYEPVEGVSVVAVRHTAEFKKIRAGIERVWLITSYQDRAPGLAGIVNTLNNWGTADPPIIMQDNLLMNPYRYYPADIEITTFRKNR